MNKVTFGVWAVAFVALGIFIYYLISPPLARPPQSDWMQVYLSDGRAYYFSDLATPKQLDEPCHYVITDRGSVALPAARFSLLDVAKILLEIEERKMQMEIQVETDEKILL